MPTVKQIQDGAICEGCNSKCKKAIPLQGGHFLCYLLTLTVATQVRQNTELENVVVEYEENKRE